jgi:hypothetical protein
LFLARTGCWLAHSSCWVGKLKVVQGMVLGGDRSRCRHGFPTKRIADGVTLSLICPKSVWPPPPPCPVPCSCPSSSRSAPWRSPRRWVARCLPCTPPTHKDPGQDLAELPEERVVCSSLLPGAPRAMGSHEAGVAKEVDENFKRASLQSWLTLGFCRVRSCDRGRVEISIRHPAIPILAWLLASSRGQSCRHHTRERARQPDHE